jgi:uncharacterized protein YjdB
MVRSSLARSIAVLGTLVGVVVGCDQQQSMDPGNKPAAERFSLSITPDRDSVDVGSTVALTATVLDAKGAARTDQTVRWSSLTPSIASVDGVGLVTGVAVGDARVVAMVGQGSQISMDTATVLVQAGTVALTIVPGIAEITLGDSLQLEATMFSPTGSVRLENVKWSTSDDAVAPISEDGVVASLQPGDVTLTATVNGMAATAQARVLDNPPASISVTPANSGLNPGEDVQLTAWVRDSRGKLIRDANVRWATSDNAVALVSMDGQVHARQKGATIITATVGVRKASATVNVFAVPASGVTITAPSNSVTLGGKMQAVATARDADGNVLTGRQVAWSSSNPSVAQVASDGTITGLIVGNTTIRAIIDSKIGSLPISVIGATPSSIAIIPASATISLGKSAQLIAEVRDQAGNVLPGHSISWSSANSGVASVSGTGVVTAVGAGTANVTATSGSFSATSNITVISTAVTSVVVSPASAQLQIGGTQQLNAVVTSNGSPVQNAAISWSSSNPAVITVSSNGRATGIGAGNATITATSSGSSGSASLTVTSPAPAQVASVTVTFNSASILMGQVTQATATARDANGNIITGKTAVWSSDDIQLASVSATGLVTALAAGSPLIVAKIDGVPGWASLTVSAPTPLPVYSVQLSLNPTSITTGQTASSSVVLRDSLGTILTGRTIGWSSSKPTVASVGLGGVVTGVGAGSATITASSGGKNGTAGVAVAGPSLPTVATVTVTAPATSLTPGQTTQATATARDAAGNVLAGQSITWTTSNAAAATVSANGLVAAVAAGSTTIVASAGGKTGLLVINVAAPATASVSVSVSSSSVSVGQSVQASASVKDANGNPIPGALVFWSSSNAAVAAVSLNGVVVGVSTGTANITASNSGKSGTVTVTVTAPQPPPPTGSVPSIAPTLPQATVNVSMPTSTRTLTVNAGGNLQAALDSAKRGDEIVIQAGATFTGNFDLKAKQGTTANGWVTVRTSALSQLPPLGQRIDPAIHAQYMPKIVTPNVLPAISTMWAQSNISGWRLIGLEVVVAPGAATYPSVQQGIIVIGTSGPTQTTVAQTPREIILDRMYVHAQSNTNTKRCLSAQGAAIAVIGSQLLDCHGKGFDSQAILTYNSPGPFLFENNRLEAAGEVIMFGGDVSSLAVVPSDITIRRNFLTRQMSWQGVWTVKNLFELKNAQRVLFEENVLENHWVDAQAGSSVVLGTADNPCSWCIVSDVTFQWNHIHNVSGGFNLFPNYGNAQPMRRVKIAQNLVTGLGAAGLGSNGRFMTVQNNVDDVWIEYNTGMGTSTYVDLTGSQKKARFTFRNNVGGGATYNWFSSQGSGDAANNANLTAPFLVASNGFVASPTSILPNGSVRVSSLTSVGFANPIWPNGNWSLGSGSTFNGSGVNYSTLQAKLVNVR